MTTLDVLRWVAIAGGAVVLGLHFAVFKNAPRITYHTTAWRCFIAGNSVLTMYALIALYSDGTNTVYIVFTAMALTLGGIIALDRSYRMHQKKEARRVERLGRRTA